MKIEASCRIGLGDWTSSGASAKCLEKRFAASSHFGVIRIAPSMGDCLSIQHRVPDNRLHQLGKFTRLSETIRKGVSAEPNKSWASYGRLPAKVCSEDALRNRNHTNAIASQSADDGKCHTDDTAFRGAQATWPICPSNSATLPLVSGFSTGAQAITITCTCEMPRLSVTPRRSLR
jgi:hypothetical protein